MKKKVQPAHILTFSIALIVFFVLLSSVIDLYNKHRTIASHIDALKEDTATLEQKYQQTKETTDRIDTPEGQEYALRDKYRMVRPGEGLIVVTDPALEEGVQKQKPALRRFWDSIIQGLGL